MRHQGNLNVLVYSLIVLAIVIGGIAAWQRYAQRQRFQPGDTIAQRIDAFRHNLGITEDWPQIGGLPQEVMMSMVGGAGMGSASSPMIVVTGGTPLPLPIQADAVRPHADRGACTNCHIVVRSGVATAPAAAVPAATAPAATAPAATAPAATVLSPREQNAAGKEFIEGHWRGLEVIGLIPELATTYQIPHGETGVLVDEITLEAAESGLLAGDLVQSIEGSPTSDLQAFLRATLHVQEQKQARVGINRRGSKMIVVIEARNTKELGFAQMEAAQPIRPGAISPHRSRGKACTVCHIIMQTGGQLPTDAGDIRPMPPPITQNAKAPHGDRGPCTICHVVR
jgi:ferredoxin